MAWPTPQDLEDVRQKRLRTLDNLESIYTPAEFSRLQDYIARLNSALAISRDFPSGPLKIRYEKLPQEVLGPDYPDYLALKKKEISI